MVGPGRRDEGAVFRALPELEENGAAHRPVVAVGVHQEVFVEFGDLFAPVAELRAGEAQDAVAGAVGEERAGEAVAAVFIAVPARHRLDFAVLRLDLLHGRVQEEGQVLLLDRQGVHFVVPPRVAHEWVAVDVVELELLEEARLLAPLPVGAANAHADFAGGVSPQHGPVLDEDHLDPAARGGDGAKEPGKASAYDDEVGLEVAFGYGGTVLFRFHGARRINYRGGRVTAAPAFWCA